MISFSNCKINIGLYLTSKREDGFHNLETIFFPVPLFDVLELIDAPVTGLTIHGATIPGNIDDNIILKAYRLLKNDFPQLPPVHFHLLKNIPIGAGLGGGSANGACALKAINKKFELQLSGATLEAYALQLGSDCPFFINNEPAFATGRGEVLTPLSINLSAYKLILVNPGIHVSTPWAFGRITPSPAPAYLPEVIQLPIETWKEHIHNQFEPAVIHNWPEIGDIKHKLYESGCVFAAMSGSGSTVFGLIEKDKQPKLAFPENYFVHIPAPGN